MKSEGISGFEGEQDQSANIIKKTGSPDGRAGAAEIKLESLEGGSMAEETATNAAKKKADAKRKKQPKTSANAKRVARAAGKDSPQKNSETRVTEKPVPSVAMKRTAKYVVTVDNVTGLPLKIEKLGDEAGPGEFAGTSSSLKGDVQMNPETLAYYQGLADTADAFNALASSGTPDAYGGFADAAGGYSDPYGGYTDPYGGYSDASGGYSDPYGGYSDTYGGYADPAGGYTDAYGGYADSYGGYTDATGGYFDCLGGYTDPSGGYSDPYGGYADPIGGYTDPTGGYSDPYGGYADPYGGYADAYGGYSDAAGTYSDPASVASYYQGMADMSSALADSPY